MDREGLAELLTPEGYRLLMEIGEYSSSDSLAQGERLRKEGHSPALVSAALTQAQLRQAARAKFGEFAQDMLFTRDGLEQATRLPVAARHAHRLTAAGCEHIADLGCGIGGDAMALAGLAPRVTAVDADEVTVAIATFNLRHFDNAVARQGAAEDFDLGQADGLWLDPARRQVRGRRSRGEAARLFDPEAFSPPLSWAVGAAREVRAAGIKLGPALPHDAVPEDAQAQWVSHGGDVVEVALWFGAARHGTARRTALVLGDGESIELNEDQLPHGDVPVGEPAGYLYEPDGAIIRAGLVGALAGPFEAHQLHPSIAYLSSDRLVRSPLATVWQVRDVLPMNVRAVRDRLREEGIGTVEIKKRGADIVPEQVRKQLRLDGPGSATLFYTRIGPAHRVILAERVPQD